MNSLTIQVFLPFLEWRNGLLFNALIDNLTLVILLAVSLLSLPLFVGSSFITLMDLNSYMLKIIHQMHFGIDCFFCFPFTTESQFGIHNDSFVKLLSPFPGFVHHSEKSSRLSLEEKRQLVHEIAQCLEDAPAVLNSFTRKELLEMIRAEIGEVRKCSGFTKPKMIEYLLELVIKKNNKETIKQLAPSSPSQDEDKFNKQQKNKYLSQLPIESYHSHGKIMREDQKLLICGNPACRAALNTDDVFCKRCSCCICHQYDENKDPSLWLTCNYDSLEEGELCGVSCHLKCALQHEFCGMMKKCSSANLDGYFCCVSCRKLNGVMGYLTFT